MSMHNIHCPNEIVLSFIKDIQQSSLLDTICYPKEDCICAYVCGSQLTGLWSDNSDIDIVVLMKNDESCFTPEAEIEYLYSTEQTIKVQWFVKSVNTFFLSQRTDIRASELLSVIGVFQFGFVNKDFIFYQNPKYDYILNNFFKYQNRIQYLGAYNFVKKFLPRVLININKPNQLKQSHLLVTRLCKIADWLEYQDISQSVEILSKIKRTKDFNNYLSYIQNRLNYLKNFLEENFLDIEKETQELIDLMYEGGINYAKNN